MHLTFTTQAEAIAAAADIFAQMVRARAATNGGFLDDWMNNRAPVDVASLPDAELTGARFPLYGQRLSDGEVVVDVGHTTAWAEPVENENGQWVIPEPEGYAIEGQAEEADDPTRREFLGLGEG